MRVLSTERRGGSPATRTWPGWGLFEEFLSDLPTRTQRDGVDSFRPAVDILEKDGTLVLRAEVPGLDQKEIELKLEGNVLTLRGERKLDESEREQYHRVESFFGTFSRSFTLPDSADREHIKADFRNGILTVTIPQKPEVKARASPVNAT
jgi:HSP20 family protein